MKTITLEMARSWYTDADLVHDFSHIERVYRSAERLATEENANFEIVGAAVLLHDAHGAEPEGEGRHEHHHASAEFAARMLAEYGWEAEKIAAVQHCIRAHRYRDKSEPPATIEAKVLFDADKLDVLGAIGVARTIQYATLAGQPVYAKPSPTFLETGKKEPGEAHSAYHEYLFKLRHVKERMFTRSGRALAEARTSVIRTYFEVLQAEINGEC